MRMVRCYDCGKQYDYDEDGFCPRCGAFNQPAKKESAVRTYSEAAPSRRDHCTAASRRVRFSTVTPTIWKKPLRAHSA